MVSQEVFRQKLSDGSKMMNSIAFWQRLWESFPTKTVDRLYNKLSGNSWLNSFKFQVFIFLWILHSPPPPPFLPSPLPFPNPNCGFKKMFALCNLVIVSFVRVIHGEQRHPLLYDILFTQVRYCRADQPSYSLRLSEQFEPPWVVHKG